MGWYHNGKGVDFGGSDSPLTAGSHLIRARAFFNFFGDKHVDQHSQQKTWRSLGNVSLYTWGASPHRSCRPELRAVGPTLCIMDTEANCLAWNPDSASSQLCPRARDSVLLSWFFFSSCQKGGRGVVYQ